VSPTGARHLEDEGYLLPRPRAACVAARLSAQRQRTIALSRPVGAVAASTLPIDDPASEGRR
jgi:hypothetical protein